MLDSVYLGCVCAAVLVVLFCIINQRSVQAHKALHLYSYARHYVHVGLNASIVIKPARHGWCTVQSLVLSLPFILHTVKSLLCGVSSRDEQEGEEYKEYEQILMLLNVCKNIRVLVLRTWVCVKMRLSINLSLTRTTARTGYM